MTAPSSQKESTWPQGMALEAMKMKAFHQRPLARAPAMKQRMVLATSCPQPQNNCSPSPKPPCQRMSLHFQAYHSQMLFAEGIIEIRNLTQTAILVLSTQKIKELSVPNWRLLRKRGGRSPQFSVNTCYKCFRFK